MNRFSIITFSLFITVTVLLSSCINEYTDWSKCFRAIRIVLNWIDTEPLYSDESVQIEIYPSSGETLLLNSNIYGTDVDLLADKYVLIGSEKADNVSINEEDSTVSVLTRGNGIVMNPTPFSAGMTTAEVVYVPDSLIIPLPMYQQTRPLIVEVEFIDKRIPIINEFPTIESISADLSGVTVKRKINDAFSSATDRLFVPAIEKGEASYNLSEPEEPREGGIWYTGANNLIGLDMTTTHLLHLNVNFEGGYSPEFTFDVTEQVAGFQTIEIHKPWYIIITLRLDSSLEVTIEDWYAGPDSWLIAQ